MGNSVATAAGETPAPRIVPPVNPQHVKLNVDGYVLRDIVVRLPAGFIASDMAEPDLWKEVQRSRQALRKLDRLTLIEFDEGAVWSAYVSEAGPEFALVSKPTRVEIRARRTAYYSDDLYKIQWNGAAFIIIRKADNFTMPGAYACEQSAIRGLGNLYPRPI